MDSAHILFFDAKSEHMDGFKYIFMLTLLFNHFCFCLQKKNFPQSI